MTDTVVRFIEIPVVNLKRATEFYASLFELTFNNMQMANAKLALFFVASDKTNGALVQGDGYIPSTSGALIYFSAGDNMNNIIERIPKLGGTVVMKKCSLAGHGYTARFIDTEGNKIGLHSET